MLAELYGHFMSELGILVEQYRLRLLPEVPLRKAAPFSLSHDPALFFLIFLRTIIALATNLYLDKGSQILLGNAWSKLIAAEYLRHEVILDFFTTLEGFPSASITRVE